MDNETWFESNSRNRLRSTRPEGVDVDSARSENGWCEHQPVWIGRVAVTACADCGRVEWMSDRGPVDHAEAMAAIFGSYDLVGTMDALGAPSPEVLVYSPPTSKKRRNLDALPTKAWLKAGPHLWMSTDGEVLLLATTQRLLFDNLSRGA